MPNDYLANGYVYIYREDCIIPTTIENAMMYLCRLIENVDSDECSICFTRI